VGEGVSVTGYEIVPYAPRFDAQIAELQTHLWCRDPARNAAYFHWKYGENPYFPEPLIRLATWRGRVVGMRGMIGTLWQVDGADSAHLFPHGDDLVIAPEHRNRRLVSEIMRSLLAEASRRGFPFALSLSAGAVTFVASLAAGWRSAGSFQPVRLKAPPPRRLARRVPGVARLERWLRVRPARDPFARLDREGSRTGPVSLSADPRPDAMAALVARLPWDGRIRHVRDATYFAWRLRNPFREYRFIFAGGEELEGYLVLHHSRADRADAERVWIADWEATNETVRERLLATALAWGRFSFVRAWAAAAPESAAHQLRARGFAPLPGEGIKWRSEGLLVRALGERDPPRPWRVGNRDLLDIADWDVRMLYSMVG
jgi:hypothetical protein